MTDGLASGAAPAVHSLRVSLGGESVPLRSDQPEEVVRKVAGYLDAKMSEAGGGSSGPDKFRVLALAALSVAGELFEAKAKLEENDKANHRLQAKAQSLAATLDRALAPQG